jgi:hypothetical protein
MVWVIAGIAFLNSEPVRGDGGGGNNTSLVLQLFEVKGFDIDLSSAMLRACDQPGPRSVFI